MDLIERQLKGAPLPNQVATKVSYEIRSQSGGLYATSDGPRKAKAIARHATDAFQIDMDVYRITTITEKL